MSWLKLYTKDFRLTKMWFLLNVVFLVGMAILLFVVTENYNPYLVALALPLIFFHMLYMFFAMLHSLRKEWSQKTTVFWLNIPKSGWQLLTAKFAAAATQLFISLTITCLICYILIKRSIVHFPQSPAPAFILEFFQLYGWIMFIGVFIASLQSGLVSTFIYMMAKSVRKWGWLLGIVLVFIVSWLWGKWTETTVYRVITEWGIVLKEDTLLNSAQLHFQEFNEDPAIQLGVSENVVLYMGTAIIDLLVIAVVLYICAWLLDNKVEA